MIRHVVQNQLSIAVPACICRSKHGTAVVYAYYSTVKVVVQVCSKCVLAAYLVLSPGLSASIKQSTSSFAFLCIMLPESTSK
jgi:hypothetical protein